MWQIPKVENGGLRGAVEIPASKSHSLRALIFALCARSPSYISKCLISSDTQSMLEILEVFGARHEVCHGLLRIYPPLQPLWEQTNPIVVNCRNSGIAWRFIAAICAIRAGVSVLHGDASLHKLRPLRPLQRVLDTLGVWNTRLGEKDSFLGEGPLVIKGISGEIDRDLLGGGISEFSELSGLQLEMSGEDSQPVSAVMLLLALLLDTRESSAFAQIHIQKASELPWLALSCDWFNFVGIASSLSDDLFPYQGRGHEPKAQGSSSTAVIEMKATRGKRALSSWEGFEVTIPVDMSSAAFLLAAAMVTKSKITLVGISLRSAGLTLESEGEGANSGALRDVQGDRILFSIVQRAGVIFYEDTVGLVVDARKGYAPLGEVNLAGAIDLVPVIAVIASFADRDKQSPGCVSTCLVGIEGARLKECDRVNAVHSELTRGSVQVLLYQSNHMSVLEIFPSKACQQPACHDSYADHRMAMAMAIRALGTGGTIVNTQCSDKTFPGFITALQSLGIAAIDSTASDVTGGDRVVTEEGGVK